MSDNNANTVEELNTHGYRLQCGKEFKGELVSRCPRSYLVWLVREGLLPDKPFAEQELQNRGADLPSVDVSSHAIDQASLRLRYQWQERASAKEGLCTWLRNMTLEALKHGELKGEYYHYLELKLKIDTSKAWPRLVTIMKSKQRKKANDNQTNAG